MELKKQALANKKDWITPQVEVISIDVIQIGNVAGVESAPVGPDTGNGLS